MPYRLAGKYQCFGEICCLHLEPWSPCSITNHIQRWQFLLHFAFAPYPILFIFVLCFFFLMRYVLLCALPALSFHDVKTVSCHSFVLWHSVCIMWTTVNIFHTYVISCINDSDFCGRFYRKFFYFIALFCSPALKHLFYCSQLEIFRMTLCLGRYSSRLVGGYILLYRQE